MGEPKIPPVVTDLPAIKVTEAQAAKAVKREVPVLDKAGKPTGEKKQVAVEAGEVLDYAVRDDRVTVVTVDGQKLEGKL